eukprot:3438058-Pleurochrysis_carterae.AAC.1
MRLVRPSGTTSSTSMMHILQGIPISSHESPFAEPWQPSQFARAEVRRAPLKKCDADSNAYLLIAKVDAIAFDHHRHRAKTGLETA